MKKLLLVITAIFSILVIGTSYYAYNQYIPNKIENNITKSFKQLGFDNVKFDKTSKKSGQIVFSNISLDEYGFSSIKEIRVYFSLIKFLTNQNHAKKIVVEGVRLSGELSKNLDITVSGLRSNKQFLSNLNNIPASTVIIKDSNIDMLSEDFGGIKIIYNGQMRLSSTKGKDIAIIKGHVSSKQKKLTFNAKIDGTLSPDGDISVIADSDQISLIKKNLNLRRGVADIKFKYSVKDLAYMLSVKGQIPSVNWHNLPLRDVEIDFNSAGKSSNFTAKGSIFGNEDIKWSAQISKENDIIKESGITIVPSYFYEILSFLQINKMLAKEVDFPGFILNFEKPVFSIDLIKETFGMQVSKPDFVLQGKYLFNEKTGNIKGSFSLGQNHIVSKDDKASFKLSSKGEFVVRNIADILTLEWYVNTKIDEGNIQYGLINIDEITGRISYNSSYLEKTKKYLDFKLPLRPDIPQSGRINLNITDPNNPLFKSIDLNIYDGNIKMISPALKGGKITNKNKLIISDIDLAELFRDAKFKDVIIYGKLGGIIPFSIDNTKMDIDGGILQSQDGGIIRLPRSLINGLFSGKSAKMQRIRAALKNYHYDFFEIRLDGDLNGRVMVTLNSSGYSPELKTKDPIDISLQIETQISLLFKNLIR